MSLPRKLHAASLPFVARALRGGRKLRYTGVALLLALMSVVLGAWIAQGNGPLEHELRVGFYLERPRDTQEALEHKLFADDDTTTRELQAAVAKLTRPHNLDRIVHFELEPEGYAEHRVYERLREGLDVLARHQSGISFDASRQLRGEADALLARHHLKNLGGGREWMRWEGEQLREQLASVVARDLAPAVEEYASPLDLPATIGVIGLVSGSITMLLLMLFAPVLIGTQMAQEVHENTLQPLTGTALSARDLVFGLTLGPAAVIALLAAPQVILFLAAALAVGHVLPALGLIVVSLASGAFLTMLAQLAGFALGRQRGASMLGVGLLAALAPLTMLGAFFALELPTRALGVLALVPHAAASHMLLEGFLPAGLGLRNPDITALEIETARIAVVVGTLGMLCFAYLGLRALERRVGELSPTALLRGEALLGALVSTVLITFANPWETYRNSSDFYLVNFALVLVPMAILLMMRVPTAETPTSLRKIPIAGLMAEFCAGIGVFFAVCIGCMGVNNLGILNSPVALAYLAWTIVVAGLLAIRVTALPMSLLAKLWAGLCVAGLFVAHVHTIEWTRGPHRGLDRILLFSDVSPFLGVLQAALLVLIPVLLLRALRHPASTTPVEG